MKKNLKFFVLALCLCPLLLLSACTTPDKFMISAKPSDPTLGSVQGVKNTEIEEGNKITLTAKENKADTNPFICWIKDYKTIVSTDKNINLTYNASTAGHYTALFDEQNQAGMLFASLSEISFSPENYISAKYDITYSNVTSGSSDYFGYLSESYSTEPAVKTNTKSVLYFGGAGTNNTYKFNVTITLQAGQTNERKYSFQVNDLLSKSSFDNDGKYVVTQYLEPFETEISFTFEKLNKTMFQS